MNETAEELCEFDLPRVTVAEVIDVDTEVFSEICQSRTGLDAREEEKERERMSDVDSTMDTADVEWEEAF